MNTCKHDYQKNGDYCQWERESEKKSYKVIQNISYCTKCGDVNEGVVEIVK